MKALLFLLLMPMNLLGQSVDTSVGGSQTLGLAGIQTSYQYKGRFGWTGIGYSNGLHISSYTNMPLRMFTFEDTTRDKYRLGLGDQVLDSGLATDEFDFRKAMVRGACLLRHTENSDLQVFVGNFSAQDMQPYLYTTYQVNSNVIGAVVGHTRLSKNLSVQSFNTFGDGTNSIQSLAWTPSRYWHLSTANGVGNSHLYLADAAEFKKNGLNLRASYTLADKNFHRQAGTYDIEPLGFNGKAEIPIGQHIMARVNHIHQLTIVPKDLGYVRTSSIGSEDLAGMTAAFFGFRAYASVSQSSSSVLPGMNYAGVASLSRNILPRWRSTFSYLQNAMVSQSIEVYQDTNEIRINNHLTFSHNFDRINGTISNTFGGRWSSNLLSFSVDNQVYSSPIAAQFGQKSVFQAWNFSIRFRTPHGTSTHLETIIDPFGKTQWGGYLSGLQYRGLNTYSQDAEHVSFSKFVVKGQVVDESGKGVWGIAMKIGGDTVISDTDGSFFVHVKNQKPMPFAVAADSSLQSLHWSVVSAPVVAQGSADSDNLNPARVVVQIGRRALAQKPENTKAIEPQRESSTTSSSVEPHDLQKTMQPEVRPVAAEPQVETNTISSNIPPRGPQVAMVLSAQDPENIQTNTSGREEEELSAANQLHDPQIASHFAIEQSPAIVVYEPAPRAGEPPASKEASPLQQADRTLKPSPAKGFQNQPEQQRPKKHNGFLHAIGGYLFAVNEPNPKKS